MVCWVFFLPFQDSLTCGWVPVPGDISVCKALARIYFWWWFRLVFMHDCCTQLNKKLFSISFLKVDLLVSLDLDLLFPPVAVISVRIPVPHEWCLWCRGIGLVIGTAVKAGQAKCTCDRNLDKCGVVVTIFTTREMHGLMHQGGGSS